MSDGISAGRGASLTGPPSALVIETRGLSRRFGRATVVQGVDLAVRPGTVYGLLGPNGAGKSTTIKMILGLLKPTAGGIDLFGEPWSRRSLGRLGASVDGPSLFDHLSAAQNLQVHAHLLGLDGGGVDTALDLVGLASTGRKAVRNFSLGMKSRLALGISLLGEPELVIADEPQNGLDPEGIADTRRLLRCIADSGRTVVLSSHVLAEVAAVADDVGVMVGGRLVHQGPLHEVAPDGDLERQYFRLTAAAGR
ncbi:ATP-binding cassette domain-containing protein [Clavibacter sp. A6099]|uniref:ATP-binding cassette domain-containing protein n=2 Tax=Clavibacter TaxID=1573 RepID=A0A399NSG1_9MICO|nr:bacitracin ABC transporter ATP-binding protein [Clavibacter cf. michiganensis LMG 26808]RII96728.1 ATP-binding cassette domain-containing protein [Clavibacter michiganensis]UKF24864.1 ATP-binding cassette domain-containing protein [Clavibacter sp. A6099]